MKQSINQHWHYAAPIICIKKSRTEAIYKKNSRSNEWSNQHLTVEIISSLSLHFLKMICFWLCCLLLLCKPRYNTITNNYANNFNNSIFFWVLPSVKMPNVLVSLQTMNVFGNSLITDYKTKFKFAEVNPNKFHL